MLSMEPIPEQRESQEDEVAREQVETQRVEAKSPIYVKGKQIKRISAAAIDIKVKKRTKTVIEKPRRSNIFANDINEFFDKPHVVQQV